MEDTKVPTDFNVNHDLPSKSDVKEIYADKEAVIVETNEQDIIFTPAHGPTVLTSSAPDGGWGWVVIFAVFVLHFIIDGLSYSFGVLFPELLQRFQSSKEGTSWILSILIGTTYGCGPIPSFLSMRFGRRAVAIAGGLLACIGALISCFANQIWQLTLFFGFVTGLGFGFLYLPAVVSVATWFDRRRSLAVGLGVCGTGFGTIVMAPVTNFLLENVGLSGCMMIYAGIALNACVFAALLRPTPVEEKARRLPKASKVAPGEQRELNRLLGPTIEKSTQMPSSGSIQVNEVSHVKRGKISTWMRNNVDLDLMRQWRFWIFCLTAFFGGISSYIPYTYLPHRAEVEAQIEKADAAFLISFIGFANLAGRLTSSAISDRPWVNRIVVYSVWCLVAGLATSLSVLCTNYALFVGYSLIYGFAGGFIIALQSVVLTDIVGLEKLTSAFGLLLFIEGCAVVVGPPMAGKLTDYHGGDYTVAFIVFGVLMAMAGVSLLVIPFVGLFRRLKRRTQ